jgi:hypothetical protein
MDMPHGVLVRSFKGPIPFGDLNSALIKDSFTGFLRASLVNGKFAEGVIVYRAGKPIIAFMSDGKADRADNEQLAIMSVAENEDSVMELFSLNDGQMRLVTDFSRDFIIKQQPPPPPPPPPAPAPKPMPVQRTKPQEKPLSMPEVRGTFVKSESPANLRSYIEARKDETGHALLLRQDGKSFMEYHLLFLGGKLVAAYSSGEAGPAFLNNILAMSCVAEFYRVDESLIQSILKMYPHVSVSYGPEKVEPVKVPVREPVREPVQEPPAPPAPQAPPKPEPKPMQVLRPDSMPYIPLPAPRVEAAAHGPVIKPPIKAEPPKPMETQRYERAPTKAIFEKPDRHMDGSIGTPAPESKSTGSLKGDMDDDADFVKKVEKEFVGNVDDLLKRLELSHLKVIPERKKRV